MRGINFARVALASSLLMLFAGQAAGAEDAAGCLVVQHYYFAKDGMEDQVLATRIRGNEVRAALGLATSRLLVIKRSSSGHPAAGPLGPGNASYLMSETVFADEAEAAAADEALVASEDYLAVRGRMATLIDHFELAVRRLVGQGCAAD